MVGWVMYCTAETQDLIFRVSNLLIPSLCILLPTPLSSYILSPLRIIFFVHRFSSSSVGWPGATKLLRAVDP